MVNSLETVMARMNRLESGCWEWTGRKNEFGYGKVSYRGKDWLAHRLVYSLMVGETPRGLDVCHRCDNPPCCNPEHLFLGTRKDNIQDSLRKGRHFFAAKTHCTNGHPLSGENLGKWKGWRVCLACKRVASRRARGWSDAEADDPRKFVNQHTAAG